MTVADDVTLDDLILAKDDLSGADIKVKRRFPSQQIDLAVEKTFFFNILMSAKNKSTDFSFLKMVVFKVQLKHHLDRC